MKPFVRGNLPGVFMALCIAAIAYILGKLIPIVGGPVFGIALGILITSAWRVPASTGSGLKFTSKYILQLAVILFGFEMNLASIIQVGQQSFLIILCTLTVALLTAYLVGNALSINRKLFTLIGVGTAICGGSAIAAASSAIEAEDKDISYSISTIFLFNVIAVFLFPAIGHLLHLTNTGFGMWAGTAINDTSSVLAASFTYSDLAGKFATVVKLTRTLGIIPITLALALLYARGRQRQSKFSIAKVFPWFVLGFLLAACFRSIGIVPAGVADRLAWLGKFLLIAAMTAIGLNTKVQSFLRTGPRALLLGAITWFVLMTTSLTIQYVTRIL